MPLLVTLAWPRGSHSKEIAAMLEEVFGLTASDCQGLKVIRAEPGITHELKSWLQEFGADATYMSDDDCRMLLPKAEWPQ